MAPFDVSFRLAMTARLAVIICLAALRGIVARKLPYEGLKPLEEPYPVPGCPNGKVSLGHYCDTKLDNKAFYHACVPPEQLRGTEAVWKDKIARIYGSCPAPYACIWHGQSRGKAGILIRASNRLRRGRASIVSHRTSAQSD